MVLRDAGVRGDEDTGVNQEVLSNVARGATDFATAGMRLVLDSGEQRQQQKQQMRPEIKGQFRQDLYQAFLDKGVPEETASEAADAVALGKDTGSSPALAEAHKIVEESQFTDAKQTKAGEVASSDNESEEKPTPSSRAVGASATVGQSSAQPEERQAEQVQRTQAVESTQTADTKVAQPGKTSLQSTGEASTSDKVEIAQKPSEMSWGDLQKTAKDITEKTGATPAGRKKPQILEFVENHTSQKTEQKSESSPEKETDKATKKPQYASAVVGSPVIRVEIARPAKPSLERTYSAGLKAAEVDSKTANSAATALVSGKGADTSAAIKSANEQVLQKAKPVIQNPLQQLYYDVLAKQGIKPDLAEAASKDLAGGKGAHASSTVRQAHKIILDKELQTTGGETPQERSWQKHSRYVTKKDPRERDQAISRNAAVAGMPKKGIEAMLRMNSPVAANIQDREGSTSAINYTKAVSSEAASMAERSKSRGPRAIRSKSTKKGVEV